MKTVLEILNAIAATPKLKEKEAIIREHASNDTLKEVFRVTYNPYINFYIRQIPEPSDFVGFGPSTLPMAIEWCLDNLATRKITGNEARDRLADVLAMIDENDRQVLIRVLKRDLRCGATDTMASKVWPNLVPEYPVMLCMPDKPKNRARIKFPALAQLKSDGKRVNAIVDADNTVRYVSRGGLDMPVGSPSMDAFFIDMKSQYDKPMVFDGELLWLDDNGEIAPREIGNGKAMKGDVDRNRFVFSIWDAIPLSTRDEEEKCEHGYADRFAMMAQTISHCKIKHSAFDRVRLIPTWEINEWDEANEKFDEVLEQGQEGLIIKNKDGLWVNDRSKDCVKMKAEVEGDFKIVGWNPGKGKYEGMIGSFQIETADGGVASNCAGMPDDVRAMDPDAAIGKIAAVMYNTVLPSKKGKPRCLFLPRLIEIRDDKFEADIL